MGVGGRVCVVSARFVAFPLPPAFFPGGVKVPGVRRHSAMYTPTSVCWRNRRAKKTHLTRLPYRTMSLSEGQINVARAQEIRTALKDEGMFYWDYRNQSLVPRGTG